MEDFLKNLNPASAGLLAAGIGVVGVIIGAYLAKSVQARNIEADRKADVYAKAWKFLREMIDMSADVRMGTLEVQMTTRDVKKLGREISDRFMPDLEIAASAQSMDLAGKRELTDRIGTRRTELAKLSPELEKGEETLKKSEKELRRLKRQLKKTTELLNSLNPTLQLTGSRLCLYWYDRVEEALTSHGPVSSVAEIQNQSKMAHDALHLWTLTARRDNRATRRGGLRLLAFVVRSAWVRGLKR